MMIEPAAKAYVATVRPALEASETKQGLAKLLRQAAAPLVRATKPRNASDVDALDALVAAALIEARILPGFNLGQFARKRVREVAMLPWQVAMFGTPYQPNAVTFDGTNDYLTFPGGFPGTDSKLITLAFSFRLNAAITTDTNLLFATNSSIDVELDDPADRIRFRGRNNTPTTLIDINGTTAFTTGVWYNILMSFDTADTGKRHLYVNDVDELTVVTYTDGAIDFDHDIALGARTDGSRKFNGDIADWWMDYDRYVDFSDVSNRRKFFTADGLLVNKGPDGSYPFGTAPTLFLSGDTDSWHTNKGSGGGMTENGAIATSSSPPGGA